EDADRKTARVFWRLQHEGWDGADEHNFRHAVRAMPPDVTSNFAASGRVPDEYDVAQVKRLDQLGKIVGIGIHVVAVPRLARSAVAAAIVPDGAVASGGDGIHLRFPGIGIERPAMTKDHRLPCSPILVVDLRAVSR